MCVPDAYPVLEPGTALVRVALAVVAVAAAALLDVGGVRH
jgi:hypothetical protein